MKVKTNLRAGGGTSKGEGSRYTEPPPPPSPGY